MLVINEIYYSYIQAALHIIREAELYEKYIRNLESDCEKEQENLQMIEVFWNQIMMEHALFIRGLLDPTECELIKTADSFANEYARLMIEARNMNQKTCACVTNTIKCLSLDAQKSYQISECKII